MFEQICDTKITKRPGKQCVIWKGIHFSQNNFLFFLLLGITIILQIITGIFLGLHYTSDLNSAYSSLFFFIREIFYGWCLRYLHSSGASFVFLFLFLHLGRAISYGSYFYNPNTWFSGIILFFKQTSQALLKRRS